MTADRHREAASAAVAIQGNIGEVAVECFAALAMTSRFPHQEGPRDRIDREKQCTYSWHMSRYDLIENALALPAAERLEIIAALWDSIDGAHTPLTPAQAAELDRRLASFEADKADVMTWEEFKAELEERAR